MNTTDMSADQNPRNLNLYNCQNVIIGDNPNVNLLSVEVQGMFMIITEL
jgi:hypothetical protein